MATTFASDVTTARFQQDVVERSMRTPVLLDFWAAWCGPCRTLKPILEKLAEEYGGAFQLGRVDTEHEQELAYAFGVQGIPFCVLVDGGRPVDAFQGAVPEAEVRRFLQRNGIEPLAPAPAAAPAAAPPVDPNSPEARYARALAALARGDVAAVRDALAGFPEEDERIDGARRIEGGLEFLEAKLDAGGPPAEAALAAARQALLAARHEQAMDLLLQSVAADRGHRGGLARRALLLSFALVGESDERVDPYRRRLATLLY